VRKVLVLVQLVLLNNLFLEVKALAFRFNEGIVSYLLSKYDGRVLEAGPIGYNFQKAY
jgi:phosphoketolase